MSVEEWYSEGYSAFLKGQLQTDNPYLQEFSDDLRKERFQNWLDGWIVAEVDEYCKKLNKS